MSSSLRRLKISVRKPLKMQNILILENSRPSAIPFDHIVSLTGQAGDSQAIDYLSWKELHELYDDVYSVWIEALGNIQKAPFFYRDVDLLSCFKRDLFFYIFYAIQKYEIWKRCHAKHSDALFLIEEKEDLKTPFLYQMIPPSPFKEKIKTFKIDGIKIKKSLSQQDSSPPFSISNLQYGNWEKAKTVIFSDYQKSKGIFKKLKKNAICFSNTFAPKIFAISFVRRFCYYQTTVSEKELLHYRKLADSYLECFETEKTFLPNLKIKDLELYSLLKPKWRELAQHALPKLLSDIDRFYRFFENATRLKSALLDEDTSPSKNAFCQIAKRHGIRSFVECHGALGHKIGFLPLTADFMFAWGNAQKRKLVRWGCPPERVLISGCNRYTPYLRLKPAKVRKKICHDLKLDPSKKIVLVAFTPFKTRLHLFSNAVQQIIDEVLMTVKELPAVQFVIKIHPGDAHRAFFENWRRKSSLKSVVIVEKYDPLFLARGADLLVVYNSTYAVDGFALKKPVICLYDSTTTIVGEFRPFHVFHDIDNPAALKQKIEALLEKPSLPSDEAYAELLNIGKQSPEDIILSCLTS